jgi:hypothetical protein
MAAVIIEPRSIDEPMEDPMERLAADPSRPGRATTSLGSFGWRWQLFLDKQSSKLLPDGGRDVLPK